MKTYTSTVQAGKITAIQTSTGGDGLLAFGNGSGDGVKVDRGYMKSRRPSVGGYFIRYASGEELFMSAGAFESRFEPGQAREVDLIAYQGKREVYGFNAKIHGSLEG